MKYSDIKDLLLTINKTDIQEITIEDNGFKLSLSKHRVKNVAEKVISVTEDTIKESNNAIAENEVIEPAIEHIEEDLYIVKSPIVGAFYIAPSPDADPFVKVGDMVEKDQGLCIIEAMKIMNEIQSEVSGEIVEILAQNEDIVEYGQPLMKIRR